MIKNRLLYLSLFLSSFIFVYFYGGAIPYRLFYLTLLLPVVSALYAFFIFLRFKYTQEIDTNFIVKGDRVKYLLSLHNEDFILYPYIKISFCGENTTFANQFEAKSLSLLPFKSKKYSFDLECKYRGSYEIGIKSVQIEDFLGIFRFKYMNLEKKYLTVYPRVVYLDKFNLKTNFMSETCNILNTHFEDMTTTSDIRKYAYGDSMKKIHWKLTAKTNNLMVKNYQSTTETSAILYLDLKRNIYSDDINTIIEDKVLEAAVSVTYYCLHNWIPINFVYFRDRLTEIKAKSPLDFDNIYKTLSKISFIESVDLKEILNIHISENLNKSNIIIFTSNLDYELYDQLYKTMFSGYEISVVYISPEELTKDQSSDSEVILSNMFEVGIDVYKINISDDVKTKLER